MDNKNHSIVRLILAGTIASLLFINMKHKINAAETSASCTTCVEDDIDTELNESLDADLQSAESDYNDYDENENNDEIVDVEAIEEDSISDEDNMEDEEASEELNEEYEEYEE